MVSITCLINANRTSENDPKSTCSIIIEVRVYLNIVTKHRDEVLLYEERLSRPKRRRILGLNTYGRKIESVLDALLKL